MMTEGQAGCMTPQQVGRIARVLRHRQRLRQVDVAHRAGVSRLTVMKLEAGQAGGLTLNGIAAVFQGLAVASTFGPCGRVRRWTACWTKAMHG